MIFPKRSTPRTTTCRSSGDEGGRAGRTDKRMLSFGPFVALRVTTGSSHGYRPPVRPFARPADRPLPATPPADRQTSAGVNRVDFVVLKSQYCLEL
jgi:hypothetical protein